MADGFIEAVEPGAFHPADCDLYLPDSYLTAGFIDLQINGGVGRDFTQHPESIPELAMQLPRWGCTSFLPTLISSEFGTYRHALKLIGDFKQATEGAQVLGAHLEGPYLSERYKGAHDRRYLRSPNLPEIKKLVQAGPLRLMTLAPELPGASEVIKYLTAQGITVAAGHSEATYEEARQAFLAGVTGVTHLFNAMPPLHHRNPGLVAAALDNSLPARPFLGLILDGVHVHPAMARLVSAITLDHLILVTDAMAGMGMPPGRYTLAEQEVQVDATAARLNNAEKTLAGSILTIDQALRNAVNMLDISLQKTLNLLTRNPARFLGISNRFGKLKSGYAADLVVLNQDLEVQITLVNGKVVFQHAEPSPG
jgi:N-acetylglucosamine-6-phosphate deacetylase